MKYDTIEPSKSPWACGVIMSKTKRGQLRFCCIFRYLNAVAIKVESRKVLRDVGFGFSTLISGPQEAGSKQNGLCMRTGPF